MDLLLAADGGIDQTINDAFTKVSTAVQDVIFYSVTIAGATFPLVVAWLALAAIIFTIYFRFERIGQVWSDPDHGNGIGYIESVLPQLIALAGLGLVVGLQRRASGGILGPILTHCTWSLTMLFVLPPVFG